MLHEQPVRPTRQGIFDRVLLRAFHDAGDQRSRDEIRQVDAFVFAAGEGREEQGGRLVTGVQRVHGLPPHCCHGLGDATKAFDLCGADRDVGRQILGENVERADAIGSVNPDAHVESPGAQDGGIDHVGTIGGADNDDVVERLDAVHFRQQLGDDHGFHIRGDSRAAGAEQGLHFVKEDDDGSVGCRERAGASEDRSALAFRLTDELVEQLRSLDRQKERRGTASFGQRVGDGLGDQGLAGARRPVQQNALWGTKPKAAIQLRMVERHLDGVAHLSDLFVQATDVRIGDVGHLRGQ